MIRTTPRDRLSELFHKADDITALGGTVTPRFETLRARWHALSNKPDHTGQVAALLTGEAEPDPAQVDAALTAAHTAALAGAAAQTAAGVLNDVAKKVLPELQSEWAATLADNYATAAKAYNTAAAELTKAAAVVDPDTPAEALMDEKPAVRTAWVDVVNLAARASAAAAFLTTAADHAGVKLDDATRLGMVASIPDDLDRRAVWDALDGKHGRAGRWGTLLRLGATLTAPGTVDGIIGYRRPKPLERRYLRVEHGLRPVDYDPETNTPADALPASGGPWS